MQDFNITNRVAAGNKIVIVYIKGTKYDFFARDEVLS